MQFKFCYLVIDFSGGSRGTPLARGPRLTYGDHSSRRNGSDGRRENYSSRRRDAPLSGHDHRARRGQQVHCLWKSYSCSSYWGFSVGGH